MAMSDDGSNDFWDPDAGAEDEHAENGGGIGRDDDRHHDNWDQLRAFDSDREAPVRQMVTPGPQDQEALTQNSANMSLAELSRMDETLLSQASYHGEEEERQRRKLERRAERARGVKKPRRPPTEIQIKRRKEYQRFKYKKGTDISREHDFGASMEYLMRETLKQHTEQKRLSRVIRKKEVGPEDEEGMVLEGAGGDHTEQKRPRRVIRKKEVGPEDEEGVVLEGAGGDSDEGSLAGEKGSVEIRHGANWNFLDQGYVTMPQTDAEKLPYYVYNNAKRKLSCILEGEDELAFSSVCGEGIGRRIRRRKTGHHMLLGHEAAINSLQNRSRRRVSVDEPDCVMRSFSLCFSQWKARMDLHGMIDMATVGSERMVSSHGRNLKRLWTRMVASGAMNDVDDASCDLKADGMNGDRARATANHDSLSNVSSSSSSSSSKSSSCFYQPTGLFSQMSYGTTSVIGTENNICGRIESAKRMMQQTLFTLMTMVHKLPRTMQRSIFFLKVAQELGANRRLWEDELKNWISHMIHFMGVDDVVTSTKEDWSRLILSPNERWAIKSFFCADGRISSLPSWTWDPTMPTHPIMKQRVHSLRSSLMRRLQCLIQSQKIKASVFPAPNDTSGSFKEKTTVELGGDPCCKSEGAEAIPGEDNKNKNVQAPNEDKECSQVSSDNSLDVFGGSASATHEPTGEDGGPDDLLDHSSAGIVGNSVETLGSIVDGLRINADLGGPGRFGKIIHESEVDSSTVEVALSSLVNHLSSSNASLWEKQQSDSSDFSQGVKRAKEDVVRWHERIISYLELIETLTQSRDANFYKAENDFPDSAPLAKAIMTTQSYFANCGMCCGQAQKKNGAILCEGKDEHRSSDESEASDPATSSIGLLESLEKNELKGIQLAGEEIIKRGKVSLANKNLTSFPSIHLSVAIAIITENLNPQAAELVSRPCCPDASDNRTPFDLISNMLTSIEKNGSLISPPKSSWDLKGKIIDKMLVQSMGEAAVVFRTCVEKDPTNVDNWSWYVATFLGMLCIAFGTHPSLTLRFQKKIKVEDENVERRQLGSFHEIRRNASIAMSDFIKFTQSHDCPMFHFAVSCMLEWRRAIFLLHCPTSKDNFGSEVRKLHAYSTYRWATKICSETSVARVHHLCKLKYLPRDALIEVLACAVEQNPCERKAWSRLVEILGDIRGNSRADKCDNECSHGKGILNSEESNSGWWGQHRVTEWARQFFRSPKSAPKAVKREFILAVSAAVNLCLSSDISKEQDLLRTAVKPSQDVATLIPDLKYCTSWMNVSRDVDTDLGYNFDFFMDESVLPSKSFNECTGLGTHYSEIQERLSVNPSYEALCMKIVVACHLMGIWHPFVSNSIWWLAVKLWRTTQTSGQHYSAKSNLYYIGFVWLSMHGLDVSSYLRHRLKHSHNSW